LMATLQHLNTKLLLIEVQYHQNSNPTEA
jgi:hypothetical protein